MLQTNGTCPYCGENVKDYKENSWEYGSPIRKCEKCGNKYINKCYHEIAVEGIEPDAMNAKQSVIFMLMGVATMIVSALATFETVHFWGFYYVKVVCIGFIGLIVAVGMIIDILRIKTGAKAHKFDSLCAESVQRLQNAEYARELASIGYDVPEQYLK